MNDALKGMIIFALIALIISPVDFVPGPADDIIMLLVAVAFKKFSKHKVPSSQCEYYEDSNEDADYSGW